MNQVVVLKFNAGEFTPRSLKSGTAATMVGGPKEIEGTKGCNCIFEGGAQVVLLCF